MDNTNQSLPEHAPAGKARDSRLEFLSENAAISSWDWDFKEDCVRFVVGENTVLGEVRIGYEPTLQDWLDATHPDDKESLLNSVNECVEGGCDLWVCEHRFRDLDGRWLWVANHGRVTERDASGRAISMMGITSDIHQQKMSQLSLSAQRDILDSADEIAKLGYWEYIVDTNTLTWSKQVQKILRVDEEFDPNLENAFEFFLEEDREILTSAFAKVLSEGEPYDLELRCLDAEGEIHFTRAAAKPQMDEHGKVYRVVGIFQDITRPTILENQAKTFFDLSPDFQATLDLNGHVRRLNSMWSKRLGYSEEELVSKPIFDLILPIDVDQFLNALEEAKQGVNVQGLETRILPDKSIRSDEDDEDPGWLSWSLSCHVELGVVFASARCISEQKRNELELREAQARAEEANLAKANFLAVMSHELRTPLNPILGFAEMLADEDVTDDQKEMLGMIIKAGERMVELVNEILEYSKVDSGRARVELVDFSLADFVERKVQVMGRSAADKGLSLNYEIDWGPLSEMATPWFRGDLNMISQVLRNLMSNAIKFTRQGEVRLRVRILQASLGRAQLEFEIEDTGIGIRSEDLGKLFDPFLQVDSGATREYGGTGLGLAICKRLVELLDGSIRVESKLNKGSKFSFQVPVEYEYTPDAQEAETLDDGVGVDVPAESDATQDEFEGAVLVVEDNESNVIYLQKLLELRGIAAVCVNDGESALEVLEEQDFALVLLDLHMPGIGGIETLKRIRANSAFDQLPIYVLTADVSQQARDDSMDFGADGLLTKPVTADLIFELLAEHLQKS